MELQPRIATGPGRWGLVLVLVAGLLALAPRARAGVVMIEFGLETQTSVPGLGVDELGPMPGSGFARIRVPGTATSGGQTVVSLPGELHITRFAFTQPLQLSLYDGSGGLVSLSGSTLSPLGATLAYSAEGSLGSFGGLGIGPAPGAIGGVVDCDPHDFYPGDCTNLGLSTGANYIFQSTTVALNGFASGPSGGPVSFTAQGQFGTFLGTPAAIHLTGQEVARTLVSESVPEPGPSPLLASGLAALAGLAWLGRRRMRMRG